MLLEVSNINTFYDVFQAVFNVSLTVDTGEVVCLLGRNGAGKTTTLSSIMGLNSPRSGSIKFKEREIAGNKPFQIARTGIRMVPENRLIFSDLTVRENLELGCRNKSGKYRSEKIDKILDLFPRLEGLQYRAAGDLSGGEQQMVTIGRSLMGDPELLLLDELSVGLAPIVIELFKRQIGRLREEKITILLTEQNVLFALDISDRAYVIDKGTIVYEGNVEQLRENKRLMSEFLGV
ncbi:MAG: ABC transporter ATP-binding protein [Desulfomonile tiedjei]|uniref:ABC transporter ATP-binding protein n=1 Tax=Desulfomonile tiedjei TaxID=2358 RepID=A0A9D6Z8Y8_9BACT|nr:ABC transporter ATP-binding protein [Desulfomonile tiedjei]